MTGLGRLKRPSFGIKEAIKPVLVQALVIGFCFLQGRSGIAGSILPFAMAAFCAGLAAGIAPASMFAGCALGLASRGQWGQILALLAVYGAWRLAGKWTGKGVMYGLGAAFLCLGRLFSGNILLYDVLALLVSGALCFLLCGVYETAWRALARGKTTDTRESLSVALCFGAALTGLTDVAVLGTSLGAMLAAFLCLCAASVGGAGLGAATGAALGAMLAMSDVSLLGCIGMLALCGAVAGAFDSLGKWAVLGAFASAGLWLFWQGGMYPSRFAYREMLGAMALFALVGRKTLRETMDRVCAGPFCARRASEDAGRLRNYALLRLSRLLPVFSSIAAAYAEREKAPENLLSVCAGCENEALCLGRCREETVRVFQALGRGERAEAFENFCPRVSQMHSQAMLLRMQRECAGVLSRQMRSILAMLGGVCKGLGHEFAIDDVMSQNVEQSLAEAGAPAQGVCVVSEGGKRRVHVRCAACRGQRLCERVMAKTISQCLGMDMQAGNYGCVSRGGVCELVFEPVQALRLVVGVCRQAVLGENKCGDSYAFGRLEGGRFYVILSDGMGSGELANVLSSRTVALVEDYLRAGLDPALATETANRYLSSICQGEERFATLDLHMVSLHDGKMEYVKVGACHSYIVRGNEVLVLADSNLPLGMFDELSMRSKGAQVCPGDLLVMVSDGICDGAREDPDAFMRQVLLGVNRRNPQAAAEDILLWAQKKNTGDDCTVLVVRVV